MALVPLASVDRSALRWLRTGEDPIEFTLSSGDRAVLTVRWEKRSGSLASIDAADGQWTVKRSGFLNPHIVLRVAGSAKEVARVTVHWNYHRIELAGGRAYRFHRAGVLVPAWQVTNAVGTEVAHLEPVRDGRRLEGGAVLVSPAGVDLPELATILGITWYFIVLVWFEDESLLPLEDLSLPAEPPDRVSPG
jgi:hypothetical protein